MGSNTYEQAMRQEARRLIAEHGELVEARCVSGPPDFRIELAFADGHEEIITRHSGQVDITMMKFGYAGTGADCFWAFLDEAGFKDVTLDQLQTMQGPQTLHKGERPQEAIVEEGPGAPAVPTAPAAEEKQLPFWADVSRDPLLVDPLILEGLEKSMCFMARDDSGPVAALIVRASSEEFRSALTSETPMSLYVHHYGAPSFDLYGVYPMIWDDPKQPFFKETWLVGAGTVTGPPDPLSEGQLSRLETLLTQEYTYFLVVDPANRLVGARRVDYSPRTQEHFVGLLPKVRAAREKVISHQELVGGVVDYMNTVSLDEVRATASRLHAAEVDSKEQERRPLVPPRGDDERVYAWRGISKLRRVGLVLWANVLACLCMSVAGYVMSGFDLSPIVYLLVLCFILAIWAQTLFQALRPTTIKELVISCDQGLVFRRKSGQEKPVITQIDRAAEIQRGKGIQIDGRSPEGKHVRTRIHKSNLAERDFWKFREDLERLIPGVKIAAAPRFLLARRLLAWLSSVPAVVALVAFLFFAGATVYDYVRGMESERIPVHTQVAIVLASLAGFLLFAGLSVLLADRRKRMLALWSTFLVLGLVATGGIVAYLMQQEGLGPKLPVVAPLELPFARGSPTAIPTSGSPFADQIVACNPGPAQNEQYASAQAALGAPDLVEQPCCSGMLQLGAGGSVLLGFSDNCIYNGPGPDFQVFGESARDDFIIVEVSADGQMWAEYPKTDESPEPFDLADVGLEQAVFVRVTDVQPGTPTGAELDAVQALNNGPSPEGGLPTDLPDALARADATLRDGPGGGYDAVGEVTAGTPLTVDTCSPDGTWARVQTPDGDTGWCNVTQLALNVSLSDYEVAEIPATPTPTAAPRTVELNTAQAEGLTQVSITGQGLERIQLVLESLCAEPLQVTISAGTIFQAHRAGTQNMVVRQRQVAYLPSTGSRESLTLLAACANMELGVPEESDTFSISTAPTSEDLVKLLSLPNFLEETFRVQQFAIWTITDNPTRAGYVGLGRFGVGSGPSDEEMQRIRALFEQAVIPTDRYQALH